MPAEGNQLMSLQSNGKGLSNASGKRVVLKLNGEKAKNKTNAINLLKWVLNSD